MTKYLQKLSGLTSEFALRKYPTKPPEDRILFEILIPNNKKIKESREKFYAKFDETNLINLIFGDKIKIPIEKCNFFNIPEGNITVYEIVHDAIPLTESLSDFFSKNPNSKYKNLPNEKYPLGLAGGNIKINQIREKYAWFSLRDCGWNIGGYYSLEEEKDFINIKKLNDAEIFEMF